MTTIFGLFMNIVRTMKDFSIGCFDLQIRIFFCLTFFYYLELKAHPKQQTSKLSQDSICLMDKELLKISMC